MDAAIKTLQDELEKQGAVLSAEARDKKQREITRRARDRQAFFEDGQAEINRMRERAQQQAQTINNEFQLKVRPIVEVVAKEKGFDLVLDSQVAFTINREYDITPQVIAKADEAEKAKPAAAAAPAAPAPRSRRRPPPGAWRGGEGRRAPAPAPPARPHELRRDRQAGPPASDAVPVRARRQDHRARCLRPPGGGQERDRRGGFLRRALPGPARDAGCPDPGVPGAGRRHLAAEGGAGPAGGRDPCRRLRRHEVPAAGRAGRPAAARGAAGAPARRSRALPRRGAGRRGARGRGAPAAAGARPCRRRTSTRSRAWPRGRSSRRACVSGRSASWAPACASAAARCSTRTS